MFRKSDLNLILDGEQKTRFLSLADEILVKMNMMRSSTQPKLDMSDCMWVRHLGAAINYQNLLVCPVDKETTSIM